MGEKGVTPDGLKVLQEILSLTRPGRHEGLGPDGHTADRVFELLEQLLRSDFVSSQDMQAGRRPARRYYLQATEAGEHLLMDEEELAQYDHDNDDPLLADHWWQLPCSLVDRTGVPQVTSIRMFLGEREWANHPGAGLPRVRRRDPAGPNRQVGRLLGISEGTVRKQLEHIYGRLGVRSRTEAVFRLRHDEQPSVDDTAG